MDAQIEKALAKIEKSVGKQLGGSENPLLLSVRSGARDSMPGMMDTILNLGMNDTTVEIVAEKTSNARFAYDSYRRFLQMYGDVVMGVQNVRARTTNRSRRHRGDQARGGRRVGQRTERRRR